MQHQSRIPHQNVSNTMYHNSTGYITPNNVTRRFDHNSHFDTIRNKSSQWKMQNEQSRNLFPYGVNTDTVNASQTLNSDYPPGVILRKTDKHVIDLTNNDEISTSSKASM